MIEMRLLMPGAVNELWPTLLPLVEEATDLAVRTAEELRQMLITGQVFGVAVLKEEEIVGFTTAQFRPVGDKLILAVITFSGVQVNLWWRDWLKMLEALAKKNRVDFLEFETRRKASRTFTNWLGFKPVATLYRRAL